ncbi:hypothetical protein BpHYR1_029590 [Brachionus plicatilis]|uniref:Uncharacterized protein n=1 Tax=Brachionus plicatilis TaxID=10195 RepID=A0A3M7SK79_BRAPC|nr:hypothetical protein BpHYR1_029590 [Brachionus plicatilis]
MIFAVSSLVSKGSDIQSSIFSRIPHFFSFGINKCESTSFGVFKKMFTYISEERNFNEKNKEEITSPKTTI